MEQKKRGRPAKQPVEEIPMKPRCRHKDVEHLECIFTSEETGMRIYVDPDFTGYCHHFDGNYYVTKPLRREHIKQLTNQYV